MVQLCIFTSCWHRLLFALFLLISSPCKPCSFCFPCASFCKQYRAYRCNKVKSFPFERNFYAQWNKYVSAQIFNAISIHIPVFINSTGLNQAIQNTTVKASIMISPRIFNISVPFFPFLLLNFQGTHATEKTFQIEFSHCTVRIENLAINLSLPLRNSLGVLQTLNIKQHSLAKPDFLIKHNAICF